MLLLDSDIVSMSRIVASRIKWGLSNRWKMPVLSGDPSRGTIFILDGVAGLQLAPHTFRTAIAGTDCSLATYYFDWHIGLPGDFFGDLVWLRRNRRQGLKLARIIRSHHRRYPDAPIHLVSYSGGTGAAVFAAESLGKHARIDTLILGASALSPGYSLAKALKNVNRCYAINSSRDWLLLGLGTSLFGTVARKFGRAAGLVGFREPAASYDVSGKLVQIDWRPEMKAFDNYGQHVGCMSVPFIRHCILPLLTGDTDSAGYG